MDKRNIWLILGAGVFILVYYWLVVPNLPEGLRPPKPVPAPQSVDLSPGGNAVVSSTAPSAAPLPAVAPVQPAPVAAAPEPDEAPGRDYPRRTFTLETDTLVVGFDSQGGVVDHLALKRFHPRPDAREPLALWSGNAMFGHSASARSMEVEVSTGAGGEQTAVFRRGSLVKTYTLRPGVHHFDLEIAGVAASNVTLGLGPLDLDHKASKSGAVASAADRDYKDNSTITPLASLATAHATAASAPKALQWAGFRSPYFAVLAEPLADAAHVVWTGERAGRPALEVTTLASAARYRVQVTPVDEEVLLPQSEAFQPLFDYYGPDFIIRFLLWLLRVFDDIPGVNMGFSILLLTLAVRACLFPLNMKAQVSMFLTSQLAPEMKKIQEKHKNDRQAMTVEMMKLQKEHGFNPLAGCLPVLMQFPVFISLFAAIGEGFCLRHAGFMLWINDLSAPDRFALMPFDVWPIGNGDGTSNFNLLIIFYLASSVIQQQMMPKPTDPQQKQAQLMFKIMIFVFAFVLYNYSCGLMLYWTASNVLSIGESWYIRTKIMPRHQERMEKQKARKA